jgi:hypothetical protein
MTTIEKRFVYVLRGRQRETAASIELPTEQAPLDFERYLKSGSGRAFVNRHFR